MVQLGTLINDRYELSEKIGSGGMAIVYKARDKKLERYVAVKILRDEYCLDETFVERFKVEARSAASLSHANVVNIYDVGNDGRIHYIVMELLEGKTLKDYIQEKGILTNPEILRISLGVALALEHAHNNHIVHRDIKPQNIIITNDGKVKVADFGIARIATEQTIEMQENASGSVYYIAPEQARGGYQDHKSDIYSLGITMYEMATGVLPFEGDTPVNVALKHIHDEMPKPSEINPGITQNVEAIVLKACEKKTAYRYQTARELLDDLRIVVNNPEEIISYEIEPVKEATMVMSDNEMKHIWNKSELNEYTKAKDPLDKVASILGILVAFIIVSVSGWFAVSMATEKYVPVNVEVPDVYNMDIEVAKTILTSKNLKYDIVSSEFHDEVIKNGIITQDPGAKSIVLEEEVIKLTLSKGEELYEVPRATSMVYDKAKKILLEAGFEVAVESENHVSVPVGDVIRQTPVAQELVKKGEKVTIYVSKGPQITYIEVPNLVNIRLSEATAVLSNLGLKIGDISYVYSHEIEKDRIVFTGVEKGRRVKEGYEIDVAVSKGKKILPVRKSFTINNILDLNQSSAVLTVMLEQDGVEKEIYRQTVTNETIWPIEVSAVGLGKGVITIYNDGVKEYPFNIIFTEEVNE